MEAYLAKIEADLQALARAYDKMDADLAEISANLDLPIRQVARLPTKRFYIIVIWTETAILSGVILFAEELRAVLGL